MRVTILGSGSAIPDGRRMQAGYLVEADEYSILVDCGSGVLHRLAATGVGITGLDAVLLSHHHLDHVADLLSLLTARWLLGADTLPIVGPTETQRFLETWRDHFPELTDGVAIAVDEWTDHHERIGPVTVRATQTVHSVPCLAFRLEFDGVVVTISGDTEPSKRVIDLADGSDLLIHDCSFPDDMALSNHSTPGGLASVLEGASIDRVLLSHLYPVTAGREREMCETVGERFDGEVGVAEDLQVVAV